MKRNKLIAMLIVMVVVLGYLRFLHGGDSNSNLGGDLEAAQASPLLTQLSIDQISSMEFSRDQLTYSIKRQAVSSPDPAKPEGESEWTLSVPDGAPTEPEVMRGLVRALRELKYYNKLTADEAQSDLKLYGLATPILRLTLNTDREAVQLLFGNKHPLSGRRYMKFSSAAEIYLVDELSFNRLNKKPEEVHLQHPVVLDPTAVREFTIIRKRDSAREESINFKRADNDGGAKKNWVVSGRRENFLGDTGIITNVLTKVSQLAVQKIIDPGSATEIQELFRNPLLTVSLRSRGGEGDRESSTTLVFAQDATPNLPAVDRVTLSPLSKATYVRLLDSKWIYELGHLPLSDLLQSEAHFRDRSPFNEYELSSVRDVEVRRGENGAQAFVLKLEGDKIRELQELPATANQQASTKEPDPIRAGGWFEALLSFEVLSYFGADEQVTEDMGLSKPLMSVTIHFKKEGVDTARLVIGKKVGEGVEMKPLEPLPGELNLAEPPTEPMVPPGLGKFDAPRYAAVQFGEGQPIPLVLSSFTWEELMVDRDALLRKEAVKRES